MANCCDYYYQHSLDTQHVSLNRVEIYTSGVLDTVALSDDILINDPLLVPDIYARLTDAGYTNFGTWEVSEAFDDATDKYVLIISITDAHYAPDQDQDEHSFYATITTGAGIQIAPDQHCGPCESVHEGAIVRCETCLELTLNECPDQLVIETGLISLVTYFAWFIDKNNHKYIFPVTSTTSGASTIDMGILDVYRVVFAYSGAWEVNFSTSETLNTKEIITNNSVEYPCIIITFEEEN